MAKNGFKVFDSDMHVGEPHDLWERYMDPAFHGRIQGLNRGPMDLGVEVEGMLSRQDVAMRDPSTRTATLERFAVGLERGFDAVSQLEAMDVEGIDVSVLFPTRGLTPLSINNMDPRLASAICRAYNDWLCDFVQEDPQRMHGSAMVAPQDIEGAVDETRRMAQKGFRSIFLRSNRVDDRNWSDPYYDPLWAECERLNIPVGIHPGGLPVDPDFPHIGSYFEPTRMWHSCHSLNTMVAVIDVIGGGVPERFPDLRIAFLEANCAWVPWLMWRMDEQQGWTSRYGMAGELPLIPSEYFKRQCFISIEPDEVLAKYMVPEGYEHTMVFSSDYPHADGSYPTATDDFLKLPLGDETRRKVLWDNCVRLYDLH